MKKRFLIIFSFASFVMACIVFIGLWHEESYEKVKGVWKVEKILLENENVTNQFDMLRVSFTDWDSQVMLPYHKELIRPYPVKSNYWKYKRNFFFDGEVEIYKTVQGYFDGIYQIEILNHNRPQLMRLYSDSIEFYLREQYFTLENPTLELDFGLDNK